MNALPKKIMDYAEARPEGTPLCARALLHLGKRAAVDQALSRLVRDEKLFRVCQGVYMRWIRTRWGNCGSNIQGAIQNLASMWGETIVPCGGSAANCLRLTTQNPVRLVLLTSGPSRRLNFGTDPIELRHAPNWQLIAPYRKVGELIRAMAWLEPREVDDSLDVVLPTLTKEEQLELADARAILPRWMAEPISNRLSIQ